MRYPSICLDELRKAKKTIITTILGPRFEAGISRNPQKIIITANLVPRFEAGTSRKPQKIIITANLGPRFEAGTSRIRNKRRSDVSRKKIRDFNVGKSQ
jgi:hypothetical protein